MEHLGEIKLGDTILDLVICVEHTWHVPGRT